MPYCPSCNFSGMMHCAHPEYCGNTRSLPRKYKMKPLARKWLSDLAATDNGRIGAHIGGSRRDLNACQSLLEAGLIKIETAFEGGLYLIAITEAGRETLAAQPSK